MATTFSTLYGANGQSITITLASLAASATVGRESTVIDNTSNVFLDVLIFLFFETGTVAGNKQLLAYLYGTVDNGATYTEGCTGSDAGFTRKDPTTLAPLAVIPAVTNAFVHKAGPYSVARAFGGVVPAKFGLVICNDTGATLSATAGNNKAIYQGIQSQGS
jgi:hypothetical protein